MSDSFKSPRLVLGFSEERRIALQRANKLKQELYAQQKKIQFSNLLERGNDDLEEYIESQDNVFISGTNQINAASPNNEENFAVPKSQSSSTNDIPPNAAQFEGDNDDVDGFDFFLNKSFHSNKRNETFFSEAQEDIAFDPEATPKESLRDHLLNQLRLDGRFATLSIEIKSLCEKIIDLLDFNGYFKYDDDSFSSSNIVAYPDYDEKSEQVINELDSLFGIVSNYDGRLRMKRSLDDYFASDVVSKYSRRLARDEFDSIVGRKTTKNERNQAKRLLDELEFVKNTANPVYLLFDHTPTEYEKKLSEEALRIVQSLDPPGVGARNIQESLLLRLKPDAPRAEELRQIITHYFDDFVKKRIGTLSEKSGIPVGVLSQIYAQPFPFSPSPAELFDSPPVPSRLIRPEIIVEQNTRGHWDVRLDDSRNDVELNPEYKKMLFSKRVDKKTKEYLRRQFLEAQALIDALRNRNSTLLRVAKAIVDFQEDYLNDPNSSPKPLTQLQIADKLGLDSSTISRACNDKWMSTPRGFVAFKSFFPKAVSGEATRDDLAGLVREIIAQEDKNKPLSDEEITKIMSERYNVKVSRKTVQEHRDRLQIPNSRSRKKNNRQKNL